MDPFADSGGIDASAGDDPEGFQNNLVDKLMMRWQNEKYAPEILPFDKDLIEDVSEMIEFVNETFNEEKENGENQDPNDPNFCLQRIDHERVKYLLRDYLRIRLWKLGQWPQHYLQPSNLEWLSDAERTYLREVWDAKKGFLHHVLMRFLPPSKQQLDEKIELLDMVRRPDLERHVYARIIEDIGKIIIPATATQDSSNTIPSPDLLVKAGETFLIRYSVIRQHLLDNKVELV